MQSYLRGCTCSHLAGVNQMEPKEHQQCCQYSTHASKSHGVRARQQNRDGWMDRCLKCKKKKGGEREKKETAELVANQGFKQRTASSTDAMREE
jgi:hypothetical protein